VHGEELTETEELFVEAVAADLASYRELPLTLFSIERPLEAERPAKGSHVAPSDLLSHDACSFDLDDAGLTSSYRALRQTYDAILSRLGLEHRFATAICSKASPSAEAVFALADEGGDVLVECASCGASSTSAAADTAAPQAFELQEPKAWPVLVDTPGASTIAALVETLNESRRERHWSRADTLKCIVVSRTRGNANPELLVVALPGDRDADLDRLGQRLGGTLKPATPAEVAADGRLPLGYLGPQGLRERGITLIADPLVAPGTVWVAGANKVGAHLLGLVAGRDFAPDATMPAVAVRDGDLCARCGGPLRLRQGVELGRLRRLRRFREPAGLQVSGPNGKPTRLSLGSYHLDLGRVLVALAERSSAQRAWCWPKALTPADVHVLVAREGVEERSAAARLVEELEAAGLRVLLDDRPRLSPGVRFADAELIGVRFVVVIGRDLAHGEVELRDQALGEHERICLTRAGAILAEKLSSLS
jgi:prolyl-tRNA synthetase